jgi:hypothetical protein
VTTWFAFTSIAALSWLGASLFLVFVGSRVAALATPDGARVLRLAQHGRIDTGLSPVSFRR